MRRVRGHECVRPCPGIEAYHVMIATLTSCLECVARNMAAAFSRTCV